MGRPIKPFATNCDAARTLRRLARVAGEEEFSSLAVRTLCGRWRRWRRHRDRWLRITSWQCGPWLAGDTLRGLAMTTSLATLKNLAAQLRIDSVRSTTEAGSGHPTSCLSAADIVSALFFGEMHFDPKDPRNPDNDRFVLSKGHAAPILYAAWADAGLFPRQDLLNLRRLDSDLEGHPTPRLSFVDVATGSLGQGICAAIGTALNARRIGSAVPHLRPPGRRRDGRRVGVGSRRMWVPTTSSIISVCVIDVNALGQSQHTQFSHNMDEIAARWKAFEWHTIVVDGHDIQASSRRWPKRARPRDGRR